MTRQHKDAPANPTGFTRRSMIAGSASVATTMAVTAVAPAAAGAMEASPKEIAKPSTPVPSDAVVAYVHDAARGEVTVIQGEVERTYRDRALVKRLLAAADPSSKEAR